MLSVPNRITHRSDFTRTVRFGVRVGRPVCVVYALNPEADVRRGGPRFGLIVGKTIGSSVVRHRVSRQLREICRASKDSLGSETDIVIRALPPIVSASYGEISEQLASAFVRVGRTGVAR